MSRQKTSLSFALSQKDSELAALRRHAEDLERSARQSVASDMAAASPGELEARIGQLTDALLQKQALLEAATAEKTTLVLQIEHMEVSESTSPFELSVEFVGINVVGENYGKPQVVVQFL
jgi:hypothetical protein